MPDVPDAPAAAVLLNHRNDGSAIVEPSEAMAAVIVAGSSALLWLLIGGHRCTGRSGDGPETLPQGHDHLMAPSDSAPSRPVTPVSRARAGLPHHLTWHQRHTATLTPGQRAADILRNAMGSWPFVGLFIAFMIVWAFANTLVVGWDPYPFILLNLFLSMLAGLQGAILLIAAKRQDGIAAALAQNDFDTNVAARSDIETLLDLHRQQLELLQDLRTMLSPPQE